jgi:DNA-binding SARP family transcriptional activator
MIWQIRMLGRFEVLAAGSSPVSFRSRKVSSLLAFLALNRGRETANYTLNELFWPDSDGDRQAQSLRRAVADLRDVLETENTRGTIVQTERGKTMLNPSSFETDADRFESLLTEHQNGNDQDIRTSEAIALYGGPLLVSIDDDWVYAYRRQYEEMYCKGVEQLCSSLIGRGLATEATRIANSAIIVAPLREDLYVSAIRGYAAQSNHSMALLQFEALEQMLDDNYGQTPSGQAHLALEPISAKSEGNGSGPTAVENTQPEESFGGAISAESRFYIERTADNTVQEALTAHEPVVLLFGPRQTGKTSLLARSANILRQQGSKIVVTDFQSLSKFEVDRVTALYRALIHSFASQLGLTYEPTWNEWIGPNSNLDAMIESLLKQVDGPVCWAMDEVDRLFGTDYADDFFGLVRSWHNRRALDPEGPWKKLSLMISYATEAHLFITDLNQSPFNVGVRVSLRDFSESEVTELAGRYELDDSSASVRVFEIVKGHPFLTRRAFAFLQKGGTISELQRTSSTVDGPFGEHLRHLLNVITRDSAIMEAIKALLNGQPIEQSEIRYRLWTAGVLSGNNKDDCSFRVPAYETYLRAVLG